MRPRNPSASTAWPHACQCSRLIHFVSTCVHISSSSLRNALSALGISLAEVERAVGVGNINLPGGALRGRDSQFLIRTINEFQDVDEIADLIIMHQDGAVVRVGDVADVRVEDGPAMISTSPSGSAAPSSSSVGGINCSPTTPSCLISLRPQASRTGRKRHRVRPND